MKFIKWSIERGARGADRAGSRQGLPVKQHAALPLRASRWRWSRRRMPASVTARTGAEGKAPLQVAPASRPR